MRASMRASHEPGELRRPLQVTTDIAPTISNRRMSRCPIFEEVFSAVVAQVGADEAKRLWNAVLQGQKRQRGRPRKYEASTRDVIILWLYDELNDEPKKSRTLPRTLAIVLHEQSKAFRRSSCELIERRIRKLVKDRSDGLLAPMDPPNDDDKFQRYKRVRRSADK